MSWFLLGILILECFLIFTISNRDIISPDFLFCVGFFVATIDVLVMDSTWKSPLHWNTIGVICGGILSFSLGCVLTRLSTKKINILGGSRRISFNHLEKKMDKLISMKTWQICFIVFNLLSSTYYAIEVAKTVSGAGISGTLFYLLGQYSNLAKFTTQDVSVPSLASWLFHICLWDGYIWGVLLAYDYNKNKKINKLLIILFSSSVLSSFIAGSRGDAICMLIGFSLVFLIFLREQSGRKKIGVKYFAAGLGLLSVIVFLFNVFLTVLKLDTGIDSLLEYMSIYSGAPIVNLDSFLQSDYQKPSIWGYNSFQAIINWAGRKFNISNWIYVRDLPFRQTNGHLMGNVYTIFFDLTKDFGVIGTMVFMFLGGIILELFYLNACKKSEYIQTGKLLYMYFAPLIIFGFFANKFFDTLITISTIYFLVVWYITRQILGFEIKVK